MRKRPLTVAITLEQRDWLRTKAQEIADREFIEPCVALVIRALIDRARSEERLRIVSAKEK